jgi:hypothetical protein
MPALFSRWWVVVAVAAVWLFIRYRKACACEVSQ